MQEADIARGLQNDSADFDDPENVRLEQICVTTIFDHPRELQVVVKYAPVFDEQ
jgi:hypothetical protein